MMRELSPLRSLCAALLLLMVVAPTISLLICQVQVCYNRYEILERLEEESLHSINIATADVHWLIPGKELRVRDRLFDVKDYSSDGPVFTFIGIFDDEEEELEKKISSHSVPGKNKIPFLLKLACAPAIAAEAFSLSPLFSAYWKTTGYPYVPTLTYPAPDPASPPPRFTS